MNLLLRLRIVSKYREYLIELIEYIQSGEDLLIRRLNSKHQVNNSFHIYLKDRGFLTKNKGIRTFDFQEESIHSIVLNFLGYPDLPENGYYSIIRIIVKLPKVYPGQGLSDEQYKIVAQYMQEYEVRPTTALKKLGLSPHLFRYSKKSNEQYKQLLDEIWGPIYERNRVKDRVCSICKKTLPHTSFLKYKNPSCTRYSVHCQECKGLETGHIVACLTQMTKAEREELGLVIPDNLIQLKRQALKLKRYIASQNGK